MSIGEIARGRFTGGSLLWDLRRRKLPSKRRLWNFRGSAASTAPRAERAAFTCPDGSKQVGFRFLADFRFWGGSRPVVIYKARGGFGRVHAYAERWWVDPPRCLVQPACSQSRHFPTSRSEPLDTTHTAVCVRLAPESAFQEAERARLVDAPRVLPAEEARGNGANCTRHMPCIMPVGTFTPSRLV